MARIPTRSSPGTWRWSWPILASASAYGHYFALVTLAPRDRVQVITATRDWTGGSLGYTPERTKGNNILALQFDDKIVWYLIALAVWLSGLLIWHWVDRSMSRYAMEAISEDEDAAAAAGVNVTFEKLRITVISALMTALAGALYCQYQMFISPDTVSGIASRAMCSPCGPGIYVAARSHRRAIITILWRVLGIFLAQSGRRENVYG